MMAANDIDQAFNLRRPFTLGCLLILVFFGVFGGWAALAPLTSAALAPGVIRVESNRKTIEHLEGGIVDKIFVREGDLVEAGMPLVSLRETRSRATLDLLNARLAGLLAREARLVAERDSLPGPQFPDQLADLAGADEGAKLEADQLGIFGAKRQALEEQTAILEQRITKAREEIKGLQGQIRSGREQLSLIAEEIKDVQTLLDKGLSRKPRLLALQRRAAEIEGSVSQNMARIAEIEQGTLEARLQIEELQTAALNVTLNELRETRDALAELTEQVRAASDVFQRSVITAPITGQIVGMQVTTEGGVIQPGETVLDIVPSNEDLIIDARVDPSDIDVVRAGLEAQVRLTAFNQRDVPPIDAVVSSVSADRFTDETNGQAYFKAEVRLNESGNGVLANHKLVAGMQADVMIVTGERTALEYLLAPLSRSLDRSFREQ